MKVTSSISNAKKYKHSFMATNSTTGNFKDVQPLFCRLLMPNANIDLNMQSFVRLAPLVFPTFGKLSSKYIAKYVPFEQIYPQTSTFLSGLPVNTRNYVGLYNSLPQITNNCLWQILTMQSGFDGNAIVRTWSNVTNSIGDNFNTSEMTIMSLQEFCDRFEDDIKHYIDTNEITSDMFVVNDYYDDEGNVTETHQHIDTYLLLAAKDYYVNGESMQTCAERYNVPYRMGANASAETMDAFESAYNSADFVDVISQSETKVVYTYRLTERGKRLRKIFVGLGYQPSKGDKTNVTLLPILAFYKAYFDAFYPKRLMNFADTYCYKFIDTLTLISQVTEGVALYHGNNYPSGTIYPYPGATTTEIDAYKSAVNNFTAFVNNELSNCYSTHDMDFCSIHTSALGGNGNDFAKYSADMKNSSNINMPLTIGEVALNRADYVNNTDVDMASTSLQQPNGAFAVGDSITAWSIKMLQRLQNVVNRNSLIGRNVERYVRSHYNSDVYNELYLSSRSVGSGSYDIDISDITSTAETSGTDNNGNTMGDYLGSYAGKGVGSGTLSCKFKADTFGYLIILQYFEVETGYYFGTDPQLFMSGRYDVPNSEWDTLGYEITPRSAFYTDNGISYEGTNIDNVIRRANNYTNALTLDNNSGFGFVPRYSRFKTSHNIVNGDFSRHGQSESLSPFYLDRRPVTRYLDFSKVTGTTDKRVSCVFRAIPYASAEWQFNSRYDWLNDYNRIFYNGGSAVFLSGNPVSGADDADLLTVYGVEDNMLMHNVIRWHEINSLKPLSSSYETEVGDNNVSTSVTPA